MFIISELYKNNIDNRILIYNYKRMEENITTYSERLAAAHQRLSGADGLSSRVAGQPAGLGARARQWRVSGGQNDPGAAPGYRTRLMLEKFLNFR